MSGELSFDTPRLRARPASQHAQAAQALQAVLEGAPAYHDLSGEGPPAPTAGADLLADAEVDPDRCLLLLWPAAGGAPAARGAAAGLLDLQLHWPDPGAAHVRLLLLREPLQGRGLGREAVEGLAAALGARGLTTLRASVTDENAPAHAFWEGVGFAPVEHREDRVTVYERVG